jgi:hypothetical protein
MVGSRGELRVPCGLPFERGEGSLPAAREAEVAPGLLARATARHRCVRR